MVYRFDLNGSLIGSYHGVSNAVLALGVTSLNTQSLNLAIKQKTVYHKSY